MQAMLRFIIAIGHVQEIEPACLVSSARLCQSDLPSCQQEGWLGWDAAAFHLLLSMQQVVSAYLHNRLQQSGARWRQLQEIWSSL
jgi:hypothetical protein